MEQQHDASQPFIDADEKQELKQLLERSKSRSRPHVWTSVLLLGNIITLLSAALLLQLAGRQPDCTSSSFESLWSPVQDAISYRRDTRTRALHQPPTEYMGYPNPLKDELWFNLTQHQLMSVGASEAAQLVDTPSNLPNHPESYIISFEVFHQLHCLYKLRQSLYSDYYGLSRKQYLNHWEHCIENLRTALMCHADTTPVSFHLDTEGNAMVPPTEVTATCRDFGSIDGWAAQHQLSNPNFLEPGQGRPLRHQHIG